MTYRAVGSYYEIPQPMAGYGSYYEFSPHQVYAGYGATAASYPLDADEVMNNIAKSDACYGPGGACAGTNAGSAGCIAAQGACNWAGQKANKDIAAALNALGYGPVAVDGSISWRGAYSQFLAANGLSKGPGYGITRQALLTMKQQLDAGQTPGPGDPVVYKKVNGELIPAGNGAARAGVSGGTLLIAALVVGGLGYAAYKVGKKKKGGSGGRVSTSSMQLR